MFGHVSSGAPIFATQRQCRRAGAEPVTDVERASVFVMPWSGFMVGWRDDVTRLLQLVPGVQTVSQINNLGYPEYKVLVNGSTGSVPNDVFTSQTITVGANGSYSFSASVANICCNTSFLPNSSAQSRLLFAFIVNGVEQATAKRGPAAMPETDLRSHVVSDVAMVRLEGRAGPDDGVRVDMHGAPSGVVRDRRADVDRQSLDPVVRPRRRDEQRDESDSRSAVWRLQAIRLRP